MRVGAETVRGASLFLALALGLSGMAHVQAQTADPTATAPNPVTTAPPARSGSYTATQGEILAAPGLRIPNGNVPWALETVGGRAALVPVHHSSIMEPANVDAETAPEGLTHTLQGGHARTVLGSTQPIFFVHTGDRTENTGDAGRGNPTGWALVAATAGDGYRTMPHVRFDQIMQGTACAAPVVCLEAESLPGGWLRLTLRTPLAAGEYALVPVPRQSRPGVLILYDFMVDPEGALPKDAVIAQGSSGAGKLRR